jgi:hypothetical protein
MPSKNKNKHAGFAILETILLLVTLFFIAAIFWVIFHHSHKQPAKTPAKVDLTKNMLIKEWGVYVRLPDTTFKVSYKTNTTDPNDLVVSSSALDKLSSDHPECRNANQFVHIKRSTDASVQTNHTQIGPYYYYDDMRPSVSPCIGTDIAQMQKLNDQAYDLYDQLPTFEDVFASH